MAKDSRPPNDSTFALRYGGRVSWGEWLLYPSIALFPAGVLLFDAPAWLSIAAICLGVCVTTALMFVGSTGAFDARSWVEGGRIQMPLMIGSSVIGTWLTFAIAYRLVSQVAADAFSQSLASQDAILYSISVWATGDGAGIAPANSVARLVTVAETVVGLSTVLVILSTAISKAFERRHERP